MAFLTLPDLELYYEISGNGSPLLLIHGLGSSSRDWENQTPVFAKNYQVIAFDLRGHGRSGKPKGPYHINTFTDDTVGLINNLEIRSLDVIGISMGGMVAFELALKAPELIRSMVLVNTYPETRIETWRERLMIWRRHLILELLGMRGTGAILSGYLFPDPGQAELREVFIQRWAKNDKRAYRASLRAVTNWDVEERLPEIECPVLVVASDQDYLPLAEKQAYVNMLPNARLEIIENAHHAVIAERPEEFNALVEGFLSGMA